MVAAAEREVAGGVAPEVDGLGLVPRLRVDVGGPQDERGPIAGPQLDTADGDVASDDDGRAPEELASRPGTTTAAARRQRGGRPRPPR